MMLIWQWLLAHRVPRRLERGQGLVEYALILIFVAVVLVVMLSILGPGLTNVYANVIDHL